MLNSSKHADRRRRPRNRRGAALMICMFIIFIVTLLVVNILDTLTLELASVRNNNNYERALYLANAGVHAVAAQLENDATWRGMITDGTYPAEDTYQATAVNGSIGQCIVTSRGVAGEVTRRVVATFEL
jgi:Tfp pilus assembly protein PilX